jgi:hypothetical protein
LTAFIREANIRIPLSASFQWRRSRAAERWAEE